MSDNLATSDTLSAAENGLVRNFENSPIESSSAPTVRTALSPSEINLLKSWIKTARTESKKFDKAARSNRSNNNNLKLILLIILAVTSGSGILYNAFTLKITDPNFGFNVTTTILSVIATVIQIVQQVRGYEPKTVNYQLVSDQYHNFAREWNVIVIQGVDDRRDKAVVALNTAETRISEIESLALPL